MKKPKSLLVTRPSLISLEELLPYLEDIFSHKIVTNAGRYHNLFEKKLAQYLDVEHLTLVSNATLGLILALKAQGLKGEVITTPFSFVATTNSLHWAGLEPVFADIDPHTLNLDPQKAAQAINTNTSAILPVHLFGRVCDTHSFDRLAKKHDIRVIYDAAQAFGLKQQQQSILNCGDASVVSFHATKIFNSVEGGAIIVRDAATKTRLDSMRNNGIRTGMENGSLDIGLNAKMCEIHSAIGLANLSSVEQSIETLSAHEQRYRDALKHMEGLRFIDYPNGQTRNNNYLPLLIDKFFGPSRDELWHWLEKHDVYAKRYFYPLISKLPAYKHIPSAAPSNLPVATRIAESILCLPIYPDLETSDIFRIIELIEKCRLTYRS